MKNNPHLLASVVDMAGKEVNALLASGKTVRGILKRLEHGTLVLDREVKFEPDANQIQEALTQQPPTEIEVGRVVTRVLVNLEDIVAIEGIIFSDLQPYKIEVQKYGDDKRSTSEADKAGAQAGPAPDRRLPSTPGDAIPT